jgi:hypothetical protein
VGDFIRGLFPHEEDVSRPHPLAIIAGELHRYAGSVLVYAGYLGFAPADFSAFFFEALFEPSRCFFAGFLWCFS